MNHAHAFLLLFLCAVILDGCAQDRSTRSATQQEQLYDGLP